MQCGWQAGEWSQSSRRAAVAIVVVGVGLRLIRYIANRSLWLDEAYLADSILSYTFYQLATLPLLHWQAAPIGFLFLEKVAVQMGGTSEYALRLVPLIAGFVSVPLFARIIRGTLPPAGGLVALVLFAGLEPLVYYSAEAKQYSLDVAVSLGILYSTICVLKKPAHILSLAVVGALGIFLSHPSILVLAASGLFLFATSVRNRQTRAAVGFAVVGIFWLVLFSLNYVALLRPFVHHDALNTYWAGGYMPWNRGAMGWLALAFRGVYTDYDSMWLPLPDIAIVATLIGIFWFWRSRRSLLAMCLLPIVLTLAAAALHRYPFSGRLILFLVPLMILFIGGGVQAIFEARLPGKKTIPVVFIVVLTGPTVGLALHHALRPGQREEMKAALVYARGRIQPGDRIYVWHISQVPFAYYRERLGLKDADCIIGNDIPPTAQAYEKEFANLRGVRVWILLTHWGALGAADERKVILSALDRMGKRLDSFEAKGAMVVLYDLNDATTATSAPAPARGSPPH